MSIVWHARGIAGVRKLPMAKPIAALEYRQGRSVMDRKLAGWNRIERRLQRSRDPGRFFQKQNSSRRSSAVYPPRSSALRSHFARFAPAS